MTELMATLNRHLDRADSHWVMFGLSGTAAIFLGIAAYTLYRGLS